VSSRRPLHVLVTGGGTVAPVDDVRRLANISTGRFSARISEAWLNRGASVWHLHSPGAERPIRRALERIDLNADADENRELLDRVIARWNAVQGRLRLIPLEEGTLDEYAATLERVVREHAFDILMLAMAASDYVPEPIEGKIESESDEMSIRCRKAAKVIASARDWAPDSLLVGFKLTSRADEATRVAKAEASCRANRADMVVANDLEAYRAGRHVLHLVRPGRAVDVIDPARGEPAEQLVDRILALWNQTRRIPNASS